MPSNGRCTPFWAPASGGACCTTARPGASYRTTHRLPIGPTPVWLRGSNTLPSFRPKTHPVAHAIGPSTPDGGHQSLEGDQQKKKAEIGDRKAEESAGMSEQPFSNPAP